MKKTKMEEFNEKYEDYYIYDSQKVNNGAFFILSVKRKMDDGYSWFDYRVKRLKNETYEQAIFGKDDAEHKNVWG